MEWKRFENRRTGWYKAVGMKSLKIFTDERDRVVDAVKAGGNVAEAIRASRKPWAALYLKSYLGIAGDFAPTTISGLKSVRPEAVKADEWVQFVTEYLKRYSGTRIRGIEQTTLELVRQALSEGYDAGEGAEQLTRRVSDTYGLFSPYRSERISRTEVVSASNLGSRAGALSTGLKLTHKWLATRDDRVRDAHIEVDGQEQAMDEPYDVDGDRLMFPGDSSLGAGPGNVINCRCAETFHRAG